jgi:uncharacterized membrane protein YphA (DoxX/SURF4 family)
MQSIIYKTMKKFILFSKIYAPSVLRFGMVAVILWFSLQQFLHNDLYTAYIPDSIVALTHMSANMLVFFNAVFELGFGILLVFGWQTRIVALLLALHLFDIMYVVGYGEIGVRDFGLAVATLVVFMNGPDMLCIQRPKPSQPSRYIQPMQSIRPAQPSRLSEPVEPDSRQSRKFV